MPPISLRPIRPADLDAVHRLQRRVEAHDSLPIATPREEIEQWLDTPHFDLAEDSRLVEAEGEVVAWGRVSHQPGGHREERAMLFGAVRPGRRGEGIGSALLEWQIERATEVLRAASGTMPRFAWAQAYDFEGSALRLFARHGMAPVRYHDEMLRDLASPLDSPAPKGILIQGWDPTLDEAARIAQNQSFADHWGSIARDRASWEHFLASHGTRLDLSFFALDGNRVVGVCVNGHFPDDEAVVGRRDGWIMQVGVVPSHRKRGVATALITASLEAFKGAGFTHSALGVDSENPSGAHVLYERLGYRPLHRRVLYQRAL